MSNDFLNKILQIRIEALTKKLVLFIGSGVSYNSGFKSWDGLVELFDKVIEYSTEEGKKYNTSELLRIPQYLYNENPEKYFEILDNNFGHLPKKTNPIIDALLKLEPKHIITTNYDELIEMSLNKNGIYGKGTDDNLAMYHIVRSDKDLIGASKSNFLIKMHGDLNEKGNIVLKEDDYLRYSETHILIETFIKSLLIDHSFIFVGYSLSDYNLQLIMSWVDNIMKKYDSDLIFPRKKHFFVNPKPQKLSIFEKKYFGEKNIEIVEFSDHNDYKELNENYDDLIGVGRNLLQITEYIAEKKSKVNSLKPIMKALNVLDSMKKITIHDILNLFGSYHRLSEQVDNVLYIKGYQNSGILSECLVLLEKTNENELSKLVKRIFLKAGIESIQVDENKLIEVGKYVNDDLFHSFMHFEFNYLNKLKIKYSQSISQDEMLVSLFIGAVFGDEKEQYIAELNSLNDHYLQEKDFFNLLVVEHNRLILGVSNNGVFFKLIKAIPIDIKPTFYLFEEYSNGFSSLVLELAELKSKYAKRFNPHAPTITTEFHIKNLSYKVFRTKFYNIFRYLYDNCVITYRFGQSNHYISDLSKIVYDFIDLAFQFISPHSNMQLNTKSRLAGGNYERTLITNEDIFLSCYYLDNADLYFLLKKHSINRIVLKEERKEYLLLSFNNLAQSYEFAQSITSSGYLNILSNFISFFKCVECTITEYKSISNKLIEILRKIVYVEDEHNYVMCRKNMGNIIGFLYHLKSVNEENFECELILTLIEDILQSIISESREQNQFIFRSFEDNVLLENLVNLVRDEKITEVLNIKILLSSTDKYLQSEIFEVLVQIHEITDDEVYQDIKTILTSNIDKLSLPQLYRAVLNKSLQYNLQIEKRLYELCNGHCNISITQEYNVSNPLYCIARIYERGIISDITPFKRFIGKFNFFDFVCMPESFDYSNFEVLWSSWLELVRYRDIIIKHNFNVVKKKYNEAISNGVSETIKVTYYKYFY